VHKDTLRAAYRPPCHSDKFLNPEKPVVPKNKSDKTDTDDKFKSLMAFRKKNGLCYKCGEKWSHGHRCPPQISLHVIEELFDALEHSDEPDDLTSDEESDRQTVMALSTTLAQQPTQRRTMKLQGKIGIQDVLILVDYGSVGTFISEPLASQLQLPTQAFAPSKFLAADGSPMACTHRISELQWTVQGHVFTSDVGILPLQCYDMIVGEDWLEECSSMVVHWKNKVMTITYKGKRIKLFGVRYDTSKCSAISARKLKGLIRRGAVSHCIQLKAASQILDTQ